jgi:DNA-binding transcriptional LysR family regulator
MSNANNIDLFVRVVEEGSFSAAARQLGQTPSSVSKQISQLEEELNARLFHRTTRKQSLTEAGEIYFQHARQIVTDLREAKLAVSNLTQAPSGSLYITAEPDLALTYLAPILPEFLEKHPEVNIRISMSAARIDILEKGIDLAIRMGHLEDSSLIARKITMSQSVICASPTYLKANGTPKCPEDLINHNCLSFRTAPGKKEWSFKKEASEINIPIKGRVNVSSLFFLRQLILEHIGVAMIPTWIIQDELKNKHLIPLLTDYSLNPPSTPITAIFANNRHLAPKIRVFVDFLSEKLKNT